MPTARVDMVIPDAFLGALALSSAHDSDLPVAVAAGVTAGTRAVQHAQLASG